MTGKRLFLLDALALIYRSYHHSVVKHNNNSIEIEKGTVYGFFEMLSNILKIQQPSHLAVAFDVKKPTFRHVLYSKYKAHRRLMPQEIANAIPIIKKVLQLLDIKSIEFEGYEADDIIGTLAKRASINGFRVFMVTPDKDFYQLVDENIFIYKLKKTGKEARIIDVIEVCNMYSVVSPVQLIDLFTFSGDRSDNIPAINGFGKRTVKKLLSEFGGIDAIFKEPDKLPEKVREMLLEQKDSILLSKKLVEIDINVPIEAKIESLLVKRTDLLMLEAQFNDLNMSNLYSLFSSNIE